MEVNKKSDSNLNYNAGLNKYLAMSLGVHLVLFAFLISPSFRQLLGVAPEPPHAQLLQKLNVELIDVTMEDVAFNPKDLEKVSKQTKKSVKPVVNKTYKTTLDSQSDKLKIVDEVIEGSLDSGSKTGQVDGDSFEENKRVLMSYRDYITNYINSSKQYPRIAEKLRQEGMVVLEFVINKKGSITDLRIKQSSSFKILDTAALNLIKSLSPFKELPGATAKQTFEVPIVYQIN